MERFWSHGNAVTVESPEHMEYVGHFGVGTLLTSDRGLGSWLHIPLPTPSLLDDLPVRLLRVYLILNVENGSIEDVTVYDGAAKVHEFAGRNRDMYGNYGVIGKWNTFELPIRRTVMQGIGISFFYRPSIRIDGGVPPASKLTVVAAGAEYIHPWSWQTAWGVVARRVGAG